MEENAVSLSEMLEARERRAGRQQELLRKYQVPLVCFTMNIAGPVKQNALILRGFQHGCTLLEGQLKGFGLPWAYREISHEVTGSTAFYAVPGKTAAIKRLTVEIEDGCAIGRLFDMDVLDESGGHTGRRELGFPERKCLLCGQPAKACARSRAHTLESLTNYTNSLLRQEFQSQDLRTIARLACQSLLYEVCTTPKPGLVDRDNSGSHRDMDCFTFLSSISALWPYFEQCARIGMETAGEEPAETFRRLRWPGKEAEMVMRSATKGINTHKGAIFSVGLLCAALGRLPGERWRTSEVVLDMCARMTEKSIEEELQRMTPETARTAGEKLYLSHGVTGIRGEVAKGFPSVRNVGLPTLKRGLARKMSLNDAGRGTLLALFVSTTDTNMIARSGMETWRETVREVEHILEMDSFPGRRILERMDRTFMDRNLSPGGSADLLAVTYFLYFLESV